MGRAVSAAGRIAITGLGYLGPCGAGRTSLEGALGRGEPSVSPVDRSAGFHRPDSATTAGLAGRPAVAEYLPPLVARRMSRPSQLAVVAARDAIADAGLDEPGSRDPETGVVVSTAFGPAAYSQRLLDQMFDDGPPAASPAVFTESVANAAASRIALHCLACGPCHTVSQREAGEATALLKAATLVRDGRARRVLGGAVEEMTPLLHALLDRFRALARPGREADEVARPFDAARNGFVASEGAAIAVVESEASADARGASVAAWVRGWHRAFDPDAPANGWSRDPARLARALARGFEHWRIAPGEIDLVVSGASGSRAGDRLEAGVLKKVWNETALPPIVAPKGVTGEYGGGFLAAAIAAAAGSACGPTAGFRNVDPKLGITPHDGAALPPAHRILVSSLASGGAAAWILLERERA